MSVPTDPRPLVVEGFITDDDPDPSDSIAELLAEAGLPLHAVREVLAATAGAGPGLGRE